MIGHQDEVRQRLLHAASDLFVAHGYGATTVELIAGRAGVSRRTFYRYFRSKDDLLSWFGAAVVRQAALRVSPDAPVDDLVAQLARSLDEAASARPRLLLNMLREQPRLAERASVWREQWSEQLARGLAERSGTHPPDLVQRARSFAAIAILTVAIDHWLHEEPAASLASVAGPVAVDALRSDPVASTLPTSH